MLIATRMLKLRQLPFDRDIAVRLFAPVEDELGGWSCRYEIDWSEKREP